MSNLTGNERKRYVRNMFGRIADRYDLLNRLMTFWQDIQWRRILVENLKLGSKPVVLDIGCGTGDLAREVRKQHPDAFVVAADLTYEMVHLGAKATEIKPGEETPWFQQQFAGKSPVDIKVDKDGGQIVSITGATITSRTVTTSIQKGFDLLSFLKKVDKEILN